MKMAAIYARVSSEQQREEKTIASQTAALIEFAKTRSLEVPMEWVFEDEGYSGATLERPGLERVRDLAAEGQIQVVLAYSPDRLSRKYAYQILLIEELAKHGVETVFVNAPQGTSAEDQLLVQFQGMIAEYERAQILERSRRGKRRYSLRRSELQTAVSYELGYVTTFRAGGPLRPMNYLLSTRCPFLWDYPTLDLKFVNNTDQTIFLSEIVIDVDESESILEPVFAIRRDVQQRHAGFLMLVNEGWVEIITLTLRFNITPGLVADAISILPPYKHSIEVGPFVDRLAIDVSAAFADDGLDLEEILFLTNGDWADNGQLELPEVDGKRERLTPEEFEHRQDRALGPFKEWVGTLAGEISYTSAAAPDRQRSVKFQTFVYLANTNRVGIPRPVTFKYQVALEANARSYKRVVTISQQLKAGDTDRFTLKIAVLQSSSHHFSLRVRDVFGQELRSVPIALECFIPRSVATSLRPVR